MFRSVFLSIFVELRYTVSEERSIMSQPIRGQGDHLVFPNSPKKHKLDRGRCDIASCHVSLNFVQRFRGKSRKCLSQSEIRVVILVFSPIGPNTNLADLAFCQVSLNSAQWFQRSRKCEKLTTTDGPTTDNEWPQ